MWQPCANSKVFCFTTFGTLVEPTLIVDRWAVCSAIWRSGRPGFPQEGAPSQSKWLPMSWTTFCLSQSRWRCPSVPQVSPETLDWILEPLSKIPLTLALYPFRYSELNMAVHLVRPRHSLVSTGGLNRIAVRLGGRGGRGKQSLKDFWDALLATFFRMLPFPDTRILVILKLERNVAAYLSEEKENCSEEGVIEIDWIGRCSICVCQ